MQITTPIAIAATAGVTIFSILFMILTYRWSKKRLKEISKRFEYEGKELKASERRLKEIETRLSMLRDQYEEQIEKDNSKKAKEIFVEINRLEKEQQDLFNRMKKLWTTS